MQFCLLLPGDFNFSVIPSLTLPQFKSLVTCLLKMCDFDDPSMLYHSFKIQVKQERVGENRTFGSLLNRLF